MSTWVEELNEFQSGSDKQFGAMETGGGMRSTFVKPKPSRKETLKAELKLLEWHKLANDAALKAALMQTKALHEPGVQKTAPLEEEAKRIRKIITNEQTKPLEVTRDFVLKYEQKELSDSERLTTQVERHIETLRTIRSKLEDRIELKGRIGEYRDWKKEFMHKKNAVMSGKTLQSLTPPASGTHTQSTEKQRTLGSGGGSRDLATVLDSLNKLAQLEARITSLEKDSENMFDKMKRTEESSQREAERTALQFKKKRAADPLGKGSVKTVYALRTKKVPLHTGVKLPRQQKTGGTFLTAMDGAETNTRDARARERQRQLAMASSGQKNLRNRVKTRKQRAVEDVNSHRKHEEALQELNKRRSEQAARMKQNRNPTVGKGASSGRKFKNKYMEDFHKLKKESRTKRAERRAERRTEPTVRTRRVPAKAHKEQVSSMTMPAISSRPIGNTRKPATKTAGTITRRANAVPTRRGGPARNSAAPSNGPGTGKMPLIVGSGVGGARALKQQKASRRSY
mmetsp:Transcript_22727/g.33206  ORF Transcript_22727/g.33206 Transcript_22727/m.33206 type:complete len:513 (+) Transcript_22727:216-1754(+)|eukprot:CAMPEP_0185026578 /NCGR_PEP_ID=MMETSP1103-20130426/10933_1 /TAXON_ID=36769 /ORGANISM="Paraphysomonas bandaiensis, Strain Caron Lab Isolate" /LENGTH=512 /DNA_ID=CAMNT_0027560205 /DNA_START=117 /DNA_END=1655 /DNA_ORIENTATION=+